jgi:hypothetical protein
MAVRITAHGKLDGTGRRRKALETGKTLTDLSAPLTGGRSFNRISGPDANSCYGCHNQPYGIPGGSGDFVASVFVLGQRFDFITFDPQDKIPTKGAMLCTNVAKLAQEKTFAESEGVVIQ